MFIMDLKTLNLARIQENERPDICPLQMEDRCAQAFIKLERCETNRDFELVAPNGD
jgi:hypothetical protein